MAKSASQNISKDMIENIKSYGDSIITLETFVESVRQTPGMYIGSIGDVGFINMIREIVQNAFDELNKKSSPCDTVRITYDERSFTLIVEDNGRGIPFDNIIRIFENQHTSSNFHKKPGEYSSGLHGVGAKVTNALSKKFIIESYILGDARRVEFDEGFPWKKGEVKIPNKENKQGTQIMFQPSKCIGDLGVTWETVFGLIKLIFPLNQIGAKAHFKAIDGNGKIHQKSMENKDGILQYIIEDTTKPLVTPIHLFKDTGRMKADILFTYNIAEDSPDNTIHAFCNYCPTTSGTHIDGLYDGIGYFFTNYMNKVYLAKDKNSNSKKTKKPITVTMADTRINLCAVIAAAHLEPMFSGQAKERLSTEEMRPFVKSMVMDALDEWSKTNPSDFNKICRYLKEMAELRLKSDKEKIKLTSKYNSSSLNGLPSKYVAPTGNKDLELWICEGDSAAGTMKNCRLNTRQGYFPIRGKILNVIKQNKDKHFDNAEVAGIISIIFHGYKDFDINKIGKRGFKIDVSKIKWSKIIFGTDADPDGKHINKLLLGLFMLYMPELLQAGMVYEAVPPLYGLPVKDGKRIYFTERMDYVKYIQKSFSKKYNVSTINNKQLSSMELSKLLFVNIDYVYEVNKISNRYSIDPVLLESIIVLRNESFDTITKKLKKMYRFLNMYTNDNVPIIEGVVNDKYQTIFIKDKLFNDCSLIIEILNNNLNFVYKVNEKVCSIYELMSLFESVSPSNIERYKGLGEMDGPKLFDSTMNPDDRVLVQYTLDDAVAELESMRYYENNLRELITTVKVSRFDVMD